MEEHEQEWTPQLGMMRAFRRALIRSLICFVAWTGLILLITPLLAHLIMHWAVLGVVVLILAAPGAAIARTVWSKLPEIAGMSGFPVALPALIMANAAVVAGMILAHNIRPIGDWQFALVLYATIVWTSIWILKWFLTED